MTDSRRAHFLWTPVVFYMAFIFGLSSLSHPPQLPEGTDKELHALLYSGLSALLIRALTGGWRRRLTPTIAIVATVLCGLYGVSDEFHQSFVPPRQVEALDVVADTVGAGMAALVVYAWPWAVEALRRRGIIQRRNGV